jgi:hypothetical protein
MDFTKVVADLASLRDAYDAAPKEPTKPTEFELLGEALRAVYKYVEPRLMYGEEWGYTVCGKSLSVADCELLLKEKP